MNQTQPEGRKALVDESKPTSRADLARVLTEWNSTTGALPVHSGWFYEVLGMMEDAYDLAQAAGEPEALQALDVSELNARLDRVYAALKDGDCLGASLAMEAVLSFCQRAATPHSGSTARRGDELMAKLLTDAELSALIQAAVNAERSACADACIRLGERTRTMRERAVALACFAAILERGMPSTTRPKAD